MIPHNYKPDAYSELMDKTMEKLTLGDETMRFMIEESIGQCLYRSNKAKAAYVYLGMGDSGKSTLLDVIQRTIGEENQCSVAVDELGKQFGLDELAGKIANICDELPESFTKSEATNRLKNLTSGGMFSVDRKYVNKRLRFFPYCGCIYATNSMPGTLDSSGVARDRFKIIRFKNKFSKKDPDYDPFIGDKLSCEEVYEYIIKIGIDGLKRYLTQGYLTMSKDSMLAAEDYAAQCDSVVEWAQHYLD
jgi:putative DNA primase/helicase